MDINELRVSRKTVIAGAGVGLAAAALAACSSGGGDPKESEASESETSESDAATGQSTATSSAPAALTKTADVPVGSGVIVDKVVVTQPAAGDFKGFSAVCTHAGCTLNEVVDGTINCPCHGSKFSLDGAVVKGPAAKPLEAKAITVQGDSILLG